MKKIGKYTFLQFDSNDISFVYLQLPMSPATIPDSKVHPVRVGVSDAFYIPITRDGVRYRLYYIYDEVEFDKTKIIAGSAVVLNPKPSESSKYGNTKPNDYWSQLLL